MRLKSLRLFGFKTFAEQTTLLFEPGVTAIVGPNGSGKSNLVDAIRWVLGEQSSKALRSGKTEDVIFAGNAKRKPLGMAEVSITFDNEDRRMRVDAAEVQLTRRAYRAGESEFFINREQVRLRDVIEVLMGTGLGPGSYAVVSQGQIDAILSSKPTERRALFEETAGVNRFIARKNESLRRLEQTEQNGVRISDLLTEVGARIPELETQARRARRFRKATARLRDLEILSYLRASASRREERERLVAELDRLEAERALADGKSATVDADLTALRGRLSGDEQRGQDLHQAEMRARAQLAELESSRAAAQARAKTLEMQLARITDDRERGVQERVELESTIARLESELAPRAAALEALRVKETEAREGLTGVRSSLDRGFSALREIEAEASRTAADEAGRRAREQATRSEIERIERETAQARQAIAEKRETLAARTRDLERASEEQTRLETELTAATEASTHAQERAERAARALTEAQEALRPLSGEIAAGEARLAVLEELEANLEGHVPGTRAVLDAHKRGDLPGIHGVVSKLIRVDEQYARALDIAFGGALSNIVTATSEDAERAIRFLSSRELGRATFLPLDTIGSRTGRPASAMPRGSGVIGYAHTLVEAAPEYAGIVAFAVGRILIVESLDVGVRLVRGERFGDTVVTLDGDEIRAGGAMTGGRYKRERSLLSRAAQARTMRERLPQLREELRMREQAAAAAVEENKNAIRERDETRRNAERLTGALREARVRVENLTRESERLERELAATQARADERETESAGARERLAGLTQPVEDSSVLQERRARLDAELAELRAAVTQGEQRERAIAVEVAAERESIAKLTAQRDGARARLGALERDQDRTVDARESMEAEIAELNAAGENGVRALEEAHARVKEAVAAGEAARAERELAVARAAELERELRAARTVQREAEQAADRMRLRAAEIDAELGMLAAQFAQNPASTEECADVEARHVNETGDFSAEITRLREEIARAQNVNLNAEAEIEELVERERFLKEQLDDLARARETLLAGIAEIERESQEQFNITFEKVRTAFSQAYARMFPGGEAKMWQTNAEQLSETGIEISVQPPGKKMMNLTSLSGGERAMTSAALIFALIAVKPSPFYLLDEVDAALDDANVERFSIAVREMAKDAQILIVTHNKQTMELAERMYGVTMADPGISSIIAADLSAGEQKHREPDLVA